MIAERLEEIAAKAESAGREAEGRGPLAASHPVGRHTTPGADLDGAGASTDEVYAAMDWLAGRQEAIETKLAAKHLAPEVNPGRMALFDLSSWWVTGRCCPLAARGYCRDGKKGLPQIEYGVLTDPEGRPVAVRVLAGNTADPNAFTDIVAQIHDTFGLQRLVLGRRPGQDHLRASPRCVNSTTVERISGGSPARPPPRLHPAAQRLMTAAEAAGCVRWATSDRTGRRRRAAADEPVRYPGFGRDRPPRLPRGTVDRQPC